MARLAAWVQASRPIVQVGIAVPLLYGQALAFAAHGTFRAKIALLVHLFGLLDGLLIAFSNDASDFPTDLANTTFNRYSGGSRVVPAGRLTPFLLAQGAILALLAMGTTCAYLVFREGRAWMVVLAAISAHLVWIHGFPPFRLAYRGLGDLVAGVGFGIVLPVVGFYAQANTLEGLHPATLFPGFVLAFAMSVTVALPDTPSDEKFGKKTLAVRRGERAARSTSLVLIAVGALSTVLAVPGSGFFVESVVLAVVAAALFRNVALLPSADATNAAACEAFVGRNLFSIELALLAWAGASALSALR